MDKTENFGIFGGLASKTYTFQVSTFSWVKKKKYPQTPDSSGEERFHLLMGGVAKSQGKWYTCSTLKIIH